IKKLVDESDSVMLHGYTSAQGDPKVRKAVSDYINTTFGTNISPDCIYMTVGAAASLAISIRALACDGDEFIAFAPFFPEYRVFVEAAGCKLVAVKPEDVTFQIDFDCFEKSITERTKGVIVNSPNNPSGVVLSKATIEKLCGILKEREARYGHPIYLIADEPYRELVYDDIEVPYLMNYYDNTIVGYSFSKSLSLPGERIGYIAVSNRMKDMEDVYAAICGAGRALGYVCAPSLFQRVAAACLGKTADISAYRENRDLLYDGLESFGFDCVHPDGAFYLFVKSPIDDAGEFCERAKKYELLLVPGDSFGCPGYVRIAYCVTKKMIEDSLPAFGKLAEEFGLKK
ncbi:MAG: pyridoxal phosphate-dependent aminotransferase, partial [Lachnospiraceae bacterium]|nr:pyridoxal phosphate-dependent aminotransferase [Lachnospiraceae bacterium]